MLDDYVGLWGTRFSENFIPEKISERLQLETTKSCTFLWKNLPDMIYRKAINDSYIVARLVHEKVHSLSYHDMVLAAIDFHCSNVVEMMLSELRIRNNVSTFIKHRDKGNNPISDKELYSTIQRLMFQFSAGVNLKRPLTADAMSIRESELDGDGEFWASVLKEPHHNYAHSYISSRLAL